MSTMCVVTPSYLRDLDLCADLHASVLECTPPTVTHHLVIPDCDFEAFAGFRGPRCRLWTVSQLIPRRFVKVPRANYWLQAQRPWPPVRGWVMQQIAKLSLTAVLDTDAVVLVDSDVLMVRPVTSDTFVQDGHTVMYREPGAVDDRLPRHQIWHGVARNLLGLAPATAPFDDYVNALTVWDPAVVRALLARIETTSGRPWIDAVSKQLHFSEDILYGVFVDELLRPGEPRTHVSSPCRCYWETTPLTAQEAVALACGLEPEEIAVLISSKSDTPLAARRAAWAELHRALLEPRR